MPTRRQSAVVLSTIYLSGLTILGAFATHRAHIYSLPIPNSLCTLSLALPAIAGLVIETSNALATALSRHRKFSGRAMRRNSPLPPVLLPGTLSIILLIIYSTIVATLAGPYAAGMDTETGQMRDKWLSLFVGRDAGAIRRIQDRFRCCGIEGEEGMAFPFPPREGQEWTGRTCRVVYGWSQNCAGPWTAEKRRVAGCMMGVAVGVFLWLIVIVAIPAIHPSALRRVVYDEDDEQRPVIAEAERYRDDLDDEPRETDSMRQEINDLNNQSNLASVIEGGRRVRPSVLIDDANKLREPISR